MSEENKEATKSAAPAPKKKLGSGKGTTVVLIVVVVIAALGLVGYFGVRYLFNKTGEELVENALESSTGENVDYEYDDDGATLETEDGTTSVGTMAEWPSGMPSSAPKFDQGTITYSSTTTGSWSVIYEEIDSTDLSSYKTLLENNGWTIVSTSTSTQSGQSIQAENDAYDLYIIAFEEGKNATLTVTEKSDY